MSRPVTLSSIDQRIAQVALKFAAEIAQLVRRDTADRLAVFLDGAPGAVAQLTAGALAGVRIPRKRNIPAHCVYPGCTKPHSGPRFSFLCTDHRDISKAEKERIFGAKTARGAATTNGAADGGDAAAEGAKAPKRRKRRAKKA